MFQLAGDATELLDRIRPYAKTVETNKRDLFLAYSFVGNSPLHEKWERATVIEEDIFFHLRRVQPRLVVLAIDVAIKTRISKVFDYVQDFVSNASQHATNSLGRDITVVGIALTTPDHRVFVAPRVVEHFAEPTHLGNGVVLRSDSLRHSMLSELLILTDL